MGCVPYTIPESQVVIPVNGSIKGNHQRIQAHECIIKLYRKLCASDCDVTFSGV